MKHKHIPSISLIVLTTISILTSMILTTPSQSMDTPETQAIGVPVEKWKYAGCYNSWCETGWYSSPAVADLDNNGTVEVVASAYSVIALEGATGTLRWRIASGHDRKEIDAGNVGRTWPSIIIADVDNDGQKEIVTAHGNGWVSIYNAQGFFEPGWPQRPSTSEVRGLTAFDLDNDGDLEIIATTFDEQNTWIYEHDGSVRPGWPQLDNDGGFAAGIFNDNITAADMNNDGEAEVVVPSDVHYINVYNADGTHFPTNSIYEGKNWGQVGVWENPEIEFQVGGGKCNGDRDQSYRTNFASGPANIADMDGNGTMEIIVTGHTYECPTYKPTKYIGIYIFNADRSRFYTNEFDWRTVPTDTGTPLNENYDVIQSVMPNPVIADLDSDGLQEILFASYDGRVHAFWLDKTEHSNWPYSVYKPSEGYLSFASEPLIADLNGDGSVEVIFSSWTQNNSGRTGKLHILDASGTPIHEVKLPAPYSSNLNWNGALAAPTLANIDSDDELEIVLNTVNSGIVAYDLPGTENAIVIWGTGRGNFQRNGATSPVNLNTSDIQVSTLLPTAGKILTYTITLKNSSPVMTEVFLTNPLPNELSYIGGLTASSGDAQIHGNIITWSGFVGPWAPVTIHYQARISTSLISPQTLSNTITIKDGVGHTLKRTATVIVNAITNYIPFIKH